MTREEAEREIRDNFSEVWAKGIIKALEEQRCTPDCKVCEAFFEQSMHPATEQEIESTNNYVKKISKPTGLFFDELVDEIDYVQEHPKVKAKLRLCDDCISRQEVLCQLNTLIVHLDGYHQNNHAINNAMAEVMSLPSVTPSCEEREKGECPYYAG